MVKFVWQSPGPFCNTSVAELHEYPEGTTIESLAEDGHQMAIEHYERYASFDAGDADDDDDDEGFGVEPEYDYWWEEYDPEKHDCIL